MIYEITNKKCIRWTKVLSKSENGPKCSECKDLLHLKNSRLDKEDYLNYNKVILILFVKFAQIIFFVVLNIFILDRKLFQTWIHRKRPGVTLDQHKNLSESDETWYCRRFKVHFFSFFNLSDYQLYNAFAHSNTKKIFD